MKTALLIRNAELNTRAAFANNGFLRVFAGAIPDSPEVPAAGNLLAELRFGEVAFKPAEGGVLTANALVPESDARDDGIAGWYRAFSADGSTALWDGTVATGGADLILNDVAIRRGAKVSIASFTVILSA